VTGHETPDRERYGRILHDERLAFNATLQQPQRMLPWDQRAPIQREADMRGAEAVAAAAVADAGLGSEGADQAHAVVAEIRRRARVWAELPDGPLAKAGRELTELTGGGARASRPWTAADERKRILAIADCLKSEFEVTAASDHGTRTVTVEAVPYAALRSMAADGGGPDREAAVARLRALGVIGEGEGPDHG
jgi:hypothetical protein